MTQVHLNHLDIGGKCFSVNMSYDLVCEYTASKHRKSFFAFCWPRLKTCCLGKDVKALTADCVSKNECALRASELSTAAFLPCCVAVQSCR